MEEASGCSRAELLTLQCAHGSVQILLTCGFWVGRSGWDLRFHSPHKVLGDADAAPRTIFEQWPARLAVVLDAGSL